MRIFRYLSVAQMILPNPWQEVFLQSLKYNRNASTLRKNKNDRSERSSSHAVPGCKV
ncbi:MAG: hypothetical protein ALAOOOJD_04279 [bacterium]|nr:hypothetical protein [bacterium]